MIHELPDDIATPLADRLARPLPGLAAQQRFAPELSFGRHGGPPAYNAKNAAVVALLYKSHKRWCVAMTLRADNMPAHAGQVCFPGGVIESGETSEQAALRELHEELNIVAERVNLLGKMTGLYVFNSNFWVTPYLAWAKGRPRFHPNPREVAELVELPLDAAMDPRNFGHRRIQRGRVSFRAPHIAFDRHRIWGATSMLLGELIAILRELFVDSAGAASLGE